MKKLILLILLSLMSLGVSAQDNIGVKFFGLSIHPKGEATNAHLMPNKLDRKAYLVMNFGVELMYEKFLVKDILSAKVIQAFYADCAAVFGGFSHIGLRAKLFKTERHSLYGGIGPTFIYRKNWQKLPNYDNPNFFKGDENDTYQYKMLWYGGELEYKYMMNNRWDFAVSFVPGYPDLMSLAVGMSYKL